ncbi:hypothetical protein S83_015846 [Arachis hypogaea]
MENGKKRREIVCGVWMLCLTHKTRGRGDVIRQILPSLLPSHYIIITLSLSLQSPNFISLLATPVAVCTVGGFFFFFSAHSSLYE